MASEMGVQDTESGVDSPPREVDQPAAEESIRGDEDSSSLYQSAVADVPSEQSSWLSRPDYSQTGAWAVFAASLTLRLKVHGSLDLLRRLPLEGTIHFDIFYVSDMFAMVASLVVAMAFTVRPPMSPMITSLLNIILVAAAASFVLGLLTFGHIEGITVNEWIVMGFLGSVMSVMVLALLLHRIHFRFTRYDSELAMEMSQQEESLNNV